MEQVADLLLGLVEEVAGLVLDVLEDLAGLLAEIARLVLGLVEEVAGLVLRSSNLPSAAPAASEAASLTASAASSAAATAWSFTLSSLICNALIGGRSDAGCDAEAGCAGGASVGTCAVPSAACLLDTAVVVTVPSGALSDVAVLCPLVTGRSGATRWLSRLTPGGLGTPGELAALWLWTVFVTRVLRAVQGVDSRRRRLQMTTMGNHMWEHARRWCVARGAATPGGEPALVDTLGGPPHPLVAVTLLWASSTALRSSSSCSFVAGSASGCWLASPGSCHRTAVERGHGDRRRNSYGPLSDGLLPVVVAVSTATLLLAMVVRWRWIVAVVH